MVIGKIPLHSSPLKTPISLKSHCTSNSIPILRATALNQFVEILSDHLQTCKKLFAFLCTSRPPLVSSPLIFPPDYLSVPLLSNFLNLLKCSIHFTDMAIGRVHSVPQFNKFFFLTVTFVNTQSHYPYANRAVKGFQKTSPPTCKLTLKCRASHNFCFCFC